MESVKPVKCKHCQEFFKRYQCAKDAISGFFGECDCPKCQGYCECKQVEEAYDRFFGL